ncbi:hypothetical protein HJC23_003459 [Cyclotella cryptica]|uniref:Cilia- and flagella-associated protein 157 n=1 Tax=Cyclotella cryptica TaxID=29204 RepID=A0ABD3QS29_9STRA|eukprot:CCRYP_002614-RA/>CCRYP_002614-RA protein AED:0.18 eAED:0.18 QI:0/-1/0/1/-1/1/1/0/270
MVALGVPQLTEETRRVVEGYDAALQQVAALRRENRSLKENFRRNEIKVMSLISHYQQEVDEQTKVVDKLKDEIRSKEDSERKQRQKRFSDKSTNIGVGDFDSRETELQSLIHMLEDEIRSLKDDKRNQNEEFERRLLHNQALVKNTFANNIDALRSMATDAVSAEVADALTELLQDNDKLACEFRRVLNEMERLQRSRESVSKELLTTRRKLELAVSREKLMAKMMRSKKMKMIETGAPACTAQVTRHVAMPPSNLEESFKESLRLCNSK